MIISQPFLSDAEIGEDDRRPIRHAMRGRYPVNGYLEWHNGRHLIAPRLGNGQFAPVRAIADGTVIHLVPSEPSADSATHPDPKTDPKHPQNYSAFGNDPEWTDKGMLILRHETEIGAKGNAPVTLTYYSVYMHLQNITKGLKKDSKVYRKDILGEAGQTYSSGPGRLVGRGWKPDGRRAMKTPRAARV
jgi:murein DD-endopeptidase MepM/ murein hydrolase activator NlpD